jgi:hypothetical protein
MACSKQSNEEARGRGSERYDQEPSPRNPATVTKNAAHHVT